MNDVSKEIMIRGESVKIYQVLFQTFKQNQSIGNDPWGNGYTQELIGNFHQVSVGLSKPQSFTMSLCNKKGYPYYEWVGCTTKTYMHSTFDVHTIV